MKQLAFLKRSNGRHWVGDGFPVQSIFSYNDVAAELSPFLLMDYAGPANFPPTRQKLGVGQHPHRGFETVTIVYAGGVSHRDSAGGGGTISAGDVQWMTAAAGLIHEEFHSEDYAKRGGPFEMVQLWVNLPARDKMSAPGYQGITAGQIPTVELPRRAGTARIIAGVYESATGPARTFTPMNVWDLRLKAGRSLSLELPEGHTAALFVLRGALRIGSHTARVAELAVLDREGTELAVEIKEDAVVLLLSGAPLHEPIIGHGPFVMNTREEIMQAIHDFNSGQFGQIAH
ncbi:pirin family protein [uncultured Lamprocystis sp.]|jgi:redox-sensitive bicupin YhaK (pirin superfamily)|uniref:pirin family protein n=2 Tax=uncultured Lamprocystis sp. TaxID=543132 RepID=UPI0025F9822B|nr:pirin family protein [uncultured Lamprocystis sp.]